MSPDLKPIKQLERAEIYSGQCGCPQSNWLKNSRCHYPVMATFNHSLTKIRFNLKEML